MSGPKFVVKRIYDEVDDADGQRVLVDRMWHRGVSKKRAQLDHWLKDDATSTYIRSWWDNDADQMDEFASRNEQELSDDRHVSQVDEIIELIHAHPRVTLLYAAKDEVVNHARVLQDYLRRHS